MSQDQTTNPLILVVNGSPRSFGRTRAIVRYAEEALQEQGFRVRSISLAEKVLPLYNGSPEQAEDALILGWKQAVKEADALLIASPEYHAGMSGALKNALDFLGSEHLRHKPVAIVAMSGGGKGGINALNDMRLVLRSLYALVIPEQAVVDKDHVDAPNRQIIASDAQNRLNSMIEQLAASARRIQKS